MPETEIESRIAADAELLKGLAWKVPHPGHPERCVGHHVAAILEGISTTDPLRADLRLIALVHDSFKHQVDSTVGYSNDNDHASVAARFAARFVDDPRVLVAVELHDELYWRWHNGATDVDAVLVLVPDTSLYLRFVQLDASTEGKDPSFLWWLRHQLAARGLLPTDAATAFDGHWYRGHEVTYVKTFATVPATQGAVARAAAALVDEEADTLAARGEVLKSHDGLRVLLIWRWHGPSTERLRRDGDV